MKGIVYVGLCALAAALGAAAASAGDGEPVIEDVLQILKDRGIVDEGQYTELVAKQQSWEAKNSPLLGRIEFSGDLRLRFENFWFSPDELGMDQSNRNRLRYRLRLQGVAHVNDYFDATFRLASGEGDPRSNNRTLGFDPDFGPDALFIDQAFITFKAPKDWIGGATLAVMGGRGPNPFLAQWRSGRFDLLWDPDIQTEGLGAQLGYKPFEDLSLFANAGYFIAKENGSASDPHVLGLQGGAVWSPAEKTEVGARLAWYSWGSLDEPFFQRAAADGSILDGLFEGAPTKSAHSGSTGDLALYLRYDGLDGWPLVVYGQIAKNFDAKRSSLFASAGKEDLGWGVGVEAGDKKKLVMLGLGYFYLEANFWPAQFTDSDLLDGFTNRKGWAFYAAREILPNTEINVTLFVSDEIRDAAASFANSLAGADRVRLQTDLLVKF